MGDDDRQIKYIKVGMEFTHTITKRILENLDGEDKDKQLEAMQKVMLDYVRMEAEYNTSKDVLAKLKKGLELENANMDRNIEQEYRQILKEHLDDNPITNNKDNLQADPRYRKLEHLISAGGKEAGPVDDDIAVTEDEVRYTDPWTRKLITEESVTNKNCKHTYDKATAIKFLENAKKNRKDLRCPVVGCMQSTAITKECLYTDKEVQRKVKKQGRR